MKSFQTVSWGSAPSVMICMGLCSHDPGARSECDQARAVHATVEARPGLVAAGEAVVVVQELVGRAGGQQDGRKPLGEALGHDGVEVLDLVRVRRREAGQ